MSAIGVDFSETIEFADTNTGETALACARNSFLTVSPSCDLLRAFPFLASQRLSFHR
jgi:hypothetical protein